VSVVAMSVPPNRPTPTSGIGRSLYPHLLASTNAPGVISKAPVLKEQPNDVQGSSDAASAAKSNTGKLSGNAEFKWLLSD
jgi:hypothetical protein